MTFQTITVQANDTEATTTCEVEEKLTDEEQAKLKEFMEKFSAFILDITEEEYRKQEAAEGKQEVEGPEPEPKAEQAQEPESEPEPGPPQKPKKTKYKGQVQGSLFDALKQRGNADA